MVSRVAHLKTFTRGDVVCADVHRLMVLGASVQSIALSCHEAVTGSSAAVPPLLRSREETRHCGHVSCALLSRAVPCSGRIPLPDHFNSTHQEQCGQHEKGLKR
jgi:hypothetical protein